MKHHRPVETLTAASQRVLVAFAGHVVAFPGAGVVAFILIAYDSAGKSLSNVVMEPVLVWVIGVVLAGMSYVIGRRLERWRVFAAWCGAVGAVMAAVLVHHFMPGLTE